MNLDSLQYFKYTAKYKNITKAAKHFYISQSSLSRHIISLENELGVKLFKRDNRKLELTSAGKIFYQECNLFIRHMESLIYNVQLAAQGSSGVLRITTPGRIYPELSTALKQVKEKHPKSSFIVESYDFSEIASAIHYGVYDIGFTYKFALGEFDNVIAIPVGTDEFSLIVSSSLLEKAPENKLSYIVNNLPLLLPSYTEPPFLKFALHKLQSITGINKIKTTYVNTSDSAILDTSLGLGYSIQPNAVTNEKLGINNLSYISLDDFSAKGTIVMVYKSDNKSELIEDFKTIVKNLTNIENT